MARSSALVEALKRELRARRITYAMVARHIGLSEISVKRMFSGHSFTLQRLDQVCDAVGIEFSELARSIAAPDSVISQLTYEQELEFVRSPKLMLVALCTLNHWSIEQILARYDLAPAECIQLLARLDKLKFIELLPNNRIRLLVSRAFAWIPDGPIQQLFKDRLAADFFRSRFAGENELLLLVNGALSASSLALLMGRLRRTATEVSELRIDDAALPAEARTPITLLLAARPWEPEGFGALRKPVRSGALPEPRPGRAGLAGPAQRANRLGAKAR